MIGFFGAGAFSDDLIGHVTSELFKAERPGIEVDLSLWRKCGKRTDPNFLNSFDLLVNAGGSMLGKCEYAPIYDIHRWHRVVSTLMAIFGTGYRYEADKEPLNERRRTRLQLLFQKAQVISVRGYRTVQHLRENGIDTSRISSVGDPVLACDIKIEREPKYIMGNVRYMTSREVRDVPDESVHRLMAQIYDWLIEHYDLPLVLVSFRERRRDNDAVGAYRTMNYMEHSDMVGVVVRENFMDAVRYMGQAVFWCGQRLHPTVFAAVQGIPFVGVEYQFEKMQDWAGTVGIDNYIDTRTATLESFKEAFDRVPKNMDVLKRTIPPVVKEIRQVAKRIVRLV